MVERLRPSPAQWNDNTMTRKEQSCSCEEARRGEGSAAEWRLGVWLKSTAAGRLFTEVIPL